MFLKDTNPNKISGWQVPISVEQINRIKVPISLVGVGYNRFRNQEDFDNCFYDNITALISKCTFAGIRNKGSIEALKQYLPKELHGKLKFHPCATSVLSRLYSLKKTKKKTLLRLTAHLTGLACVTGAGRMK